jgi:hypothetical protein
MSRRSAFISGTLSARLARTAAVARHARQQLVAPRLERLRAAELAQVVQHRARERHGIGVLERRGHAAHAQRRRAERREREAERSSASRARSRCTISSGSAAKLAGTSSGCTGTAIGRARP